MCLGLMSTSWVYYNILSICICIGAIKVLRFPSLKTATYSLSLIMALILLMTFWSVLALPRSMNDYASELSSPLVLEVPDLNNNLYKKCSWLSVFDIVLPGAILAYLRDYDENYQVGCMKGVYTVTGIGAYGASCLCWVLIEALVEYNTPFCMIAYPVFMGSILLVAAQRNELETLWEGYFYYETDASTLGLVDGYRGSDSSVDFARILQVKLENS